MQPSVVRANDFYFNPRPPRGGRRLYPVLHLATVAFQSTPSARRATAGSSNESGASVFQSTPSARRATRSLRQGRFQRIISIHALREEGDAST